jgi:Ran-binding protein 1
VLCRRSKLFVFGEAILDRGSGKKSWLERGVGEMKILK